MNIYETLYSNLKLILNLNTKVTLILVVIIFISIYCASLWRNRIENSGNYTLPPGPIGLPLFGYWPYLRKEPHKILNNLAKKYGNFFSLYLGQNLTVVLNDWESVKDALSQPQVLDRPPTLFNTVPYGLGFNGINGNEWLEQRKFGVKTMKELGLGRPKWEELLQEEVTETVRQIQSHAGRPLDVCDLFSMAFTHNVMTMAFGRSYPYGHPSVRAASDTLGTIFQMAPSLDLGNFLPRTSAFLTRIGLYGSMGMMRKAKEYSDLIGTFIKGMLKNYEDDHQASFVSKFYQEVQNNKANNLGNSFTEHTLRGNTQIVIVGGSETTQNGFVWLLVCMAQFQEHQDKVRQELDAVLSGGAISWAERTSVPYTYACIMESLRWITTVPINTLRMTSNDVTIQGYHIPKGTVVVTNIWALHNDPKYWSEPHKFDPHRFLSDEGKTVNLRPESYIPFSFGKRNCPGEKIAMMEILLYFTSLMQKFKILPATESNVKFDTHLGLTYTPMNVRLRFVPRE